jgi:8-oxo-dGTP pyrophosphatase MutT (NUDIX family)
VTPLEIARALTTWSGRAERSDADTSRQLGPQDQTARDDPPEKVLVPAAVLVPLIKREEGLSVLLTQRTAHLANHAGQISFPGGRVEAEDPDPIGAALRETEEEIGLAPSEVQILGQLDEYVTGTGFKVFPVVGLIHPPLTLVPDPFEVAEIFEVPLAFVLDPSNHQRHSRVMPTGERRYYYAMPFHERFIWGATAAMLVNLYDVLRQR